MARVILENGLPGLPGSRKKICLQDSIGVNADSTSPNHRQSRRNLFCILALDVTNPATSKRLRLSSGRRSANMVGRSDGRGKGALRRRRIQRYNCLYFCYIGILSVS